MNTITENFTQVDDLIKSALKSDMVLINQLVKYIIMAGGKRLRPKLVLLAAKACGYQGSKHIKLAAIIEFIHTATLLHDDVVDESSLRRGQDTANEIFGNQAAVLTGDFLYSRSFQMMVDIDNMQVMQILSDTTNVISEGEVLQLMNTHKPDISEAEYFEVIYRKTARLFESATELGAVIADSTATIRQAVKHYGKHVGTAFQIIDDVLDFKADKADIGKNIGDDLAEGKVTLPLIQAMKMGNNSQKELITQVITDTESDKLDKVIDIIIETKADQYCLQKAKEQIDLALTAIELVPPSEYRKEMIAIAKDSVNRTN